MFDVSFIETYFSSLLTLLLVSNSRSILISPEFSEITLWPAIYCSYSCSGTLYKRVLLFNFSWWIKLNAFLFLVFSLRAILLWNLFEVYLSITSAALSTFIAGVSVTLISSSKLSIDLVFAMFEFKPLYLFKPPGLDLFIFILWPESSSDEL